MFSLWFHIFLLLLSYVFLNLEYLSVSLLSMFTSNTELSWIFGHLDMSLWAILLTKEGTYVCYHPLSRKYFISKVIIFQKNMSYSIRHQPYWESVNKFDYEFELTILGHNFSKTFVSVSIFCEYTLSSNLKSTPSHESAYELSICLFWVNPVTPQIFRICIFNLIKFELI